MKISVCLEAHNLYINGMSKEKIAERLNISVNSVSSRITDIRRCRQRSEKRGQKSK